MNTIHSQTKHELYQQVRTYENLQLEHEAHEKYLRKLLREYQRELASLTQTLEQYNAIGGLLGEALFEEISANREQSSFKEVEKTSLALGPHQDRDRDILLREADTVVLEKETLLFPTADSEASNEADEDQATNTMAANKEDTNENKREGSTAEIYEKIGSEEPSEEVGEPRKPVNNQELLQEPLTAEIQTDSELKSKTNEEHRHSRSAVARRIPKKKTQVEEIEDYLFVCLNRAEKKGRTEENVKLRRSEVHSLLMETDFLVNAFQQFRQAANYTTDFSTEQQKRIERALTIFPEKYDNLFERVTNHAFYRRKLDLSDSEWNYWHFYRVFSLYCEWRNKQVSFQTLLWKMLEIRKENR